MTTLRDRLIERAVKLGIDDQLRTIRDSLPTPARQRNRFADLSLRLLLSFTLAENANCIDIGAYRGKVLSEMIRVAPYGKHIAYEPQPEKHKELVERFPSVDIRQTALSNQKGEATFNIVKNLPGYSGLREISYPREPQIEKLTVRTETLDESLPTGYVPALIKIDVEGAEGFVLEGGIKTITQYKPIIVFEYGKAGAQHYDTGPRHFYELLHDEVGLRIFDMDGNGPYSLAEFEDTCARDERWDYIAHR
jgi:FkbM family methyltransferase